MFRWLQGSIIPRNPDNLEFLKPVQCAYDNDLAVAVSYLGALWSRWHWRFTPWIILLASIGTVANDGFRMALKDVNPCLWHWTWEKCEEFREMQICQLRQVRWNHDRSWWRQHSEKSASACWRSILLPTALLNDFCKIKIYAISVLRFVGPYAHPTKRPSRPRSMPFSGPRQDRTTLYRPPFLELALYVVSVLTCSVFIPSALRLAIELLHARPRIAKALRKSIWLVDTVVLIFSLSLPCWRKNFFFPLSPRAPRLLLRLFVVWTVMTHLVEVRRTRSRRWTLDCLSTNSINQTLLDYFPVGPRESWDRSVVIVLLTSCSTWNWYRVLLVLG